LVVGKVTSKAARLATSEEKVRRVNDEERILIKKEWDGARERKVVDESRRKNKERRRRLSFAKHESLFSLLWSQPLLALTPTFFTPLKLGPCLSLSRESSL
jgi:hypothetical protein